MPATRLIVSPSRLLAFSWVAWLERSKGDPLEESPWCVVLVDVLEAVFVEASPVVGVGEEALEPDVVRAATEAPVMIDTTGPVEAITDDVVGPVYVARTVCSASSALSTACSDSGWPSVSQAACHALRGAINVRGSVSAWQPCLTQEVSEVNVEPVAWVQRPSIDVSSGQKVKAVAVQSRAASDASWSWQFGNVVWKQACQHVGIELMKPPVCWAELRENLAMIQRMASKEWEWSPSIVAASVPTTDEKI